MKKILACRSDLKLFAFYLRNGDQHNFDMAISSRQEKTIFVKISRWDGPK